MIAQLTGEIVALGASWLVIDVNGVGYRVETTPALNASAQLGASLTIATALVVREDSMTLYGFVDAEERDTFELVQTASGIGPKTAQAVVSVLSPAELRTAISTENLATLTRVPGIGRKGAQRMVLELKDKINVLGAVNEDLPVETTMSARVGWQEQVTAGLVSLGWSPRDAAKACERVVPLAEENPDWSVGDLMKAALRQMAR